MKPPTPPLPCLGFPQWVVRLGDATGRRTDGGRLREPRGPDQRQRNPESELKMLLLLRHPNSGPARPAGAAAPRGLQRGPAWRPQLSGDRAAPHLVPAWAPGRGQPLVPVPLRPLRPLPTGPGPMNVSRPAEGRENPWQSTGPARSVGAASPKSSLGRAVPAPHRLGEDPEWDLERHSVTPETVRGSRPEEGREE